MTCFLMHFTVYNFERLLSRSLSEVEGQSKQSEISYFLIKRENFRHFIPLNDNMCIICYSFPNFREITNPITRVIIAIKPDMLKVNPGYI